MLPSNYVNFAIILWILFMGLTLGYSSSTKTELTWTFFAIGWAVIILAFILPRNAMTIPFSK